MALTTQALVRCGVPEEKARAHLPHITTAMREHEITNQRRARMFLAQVMHESAALRYFEEIASGAAYEGRRDLGNVRPGDGRRFKGRGPIQLTGRSNYTLFGKLLGIDLAGHPELAATPRVGWRVAALYFQRRGCNAAADRNDFAGVTRLINGGMNGYDDRLRYYKLLAGVAVVPGVPYLRTGDHGDAVVTMTRRLSFVRSKATGEPYLDGKRKTFDAESAKALRAFQREHELTVDGRFGPRSARALARATAGEKRRRTKAREAAPAAATATTAGASTTTTVERPRRGGGASDRPRKPPTTAGDRPRRPAVTSAQLLAGLERLDERGDRLRAALLARRRLLERALERQRSLTVGELDDLAKLLGRLEAAVDEVQGAITRAREPAPAMKVGDAVVTQASPDELGERLLALNAEEDRVRALLSEQFRTLERKVGVERRPPDRPVARPRREPRPRPAPRRPAADDGPGGAAAALRPDSKSYRVRQSKVALARYLRRHRRETTRQLRRTLLVEVRSPKTAKVATPAWERAVREAQAIAGLPVSGRLDPALAKVLRRDWPTESALRRLVRGSPAWRLIPGQLSPNFNLREFACHDGTPYIDGLVREQGLSKDQAKKRASQLADRLERLRAREGNRVILLNSVFRTKAHNARVGGVPNSAHTRGYAADIRPPAGVSIPAHHGHVRAVFSGGVGRYATFVHGDFAPEERGQNWTG